MLISKKKVLSLVKALPSQVDVDDLIYKLYLQQKLSLAEQDVKNDRVLSHKQVVREVRKWFK